MNFQNLLSGYAPYDGIIKNLGNTPISVCGVVDTARAQLISALAAHHGGNTLVVTYSDMESRAVADNLRLYTDRVAVFPSKEYIFYDIETANRTDSNVRLSVLDKIINDEDIIVVASVEALLAYTAESEQFKKGIINFRTGDIYEIWELSEKLVSIGYKRVDMIEGTGQFAVRGGIVDIYSPGIAMPVRIEFWDDEIDSIRVFDADTQRTIENTDSARAIPVTEAMYSDKRRDEIILELKRRAKNAMTHKDKAEYAANLNADAELFKERRSFPSVDKYISLIYGGVPSLIDYFSDDELVFVVDPKRFFERVRAVEWETAQTLLELKKKQVIGSEKTAFYYEGAELIKEISNKKLIALEMLSHTRNDFTFKQLISFTTKTTVSFHGKLQYLIDDLDRWNKDGYTAIVLASTESRAKNLCGVFGERGINARICTDGNFKKGETIVLVGNQSGGFEYPDIKFVLVSEREIFNSQRAATQRRKEAQGRIKSYSDINSGDYVIHATHGIGEYVGLEKKTVNGISKDYLKIRYLNNDALYVPIEQLNMLYKYSGSEGKKPKLSHLGTQEWTRTKRKAKEATDKLAGELIKLYAERENRRGHAFSEDTPWQRDFEDNFPYTETPDQLRSVEEVKADMESEKPMDRLLCGDVGFGKTEVALRAAFKAVCDSKQVAYLCPTTVLAMQQFDTFRSRMENFPMTVAMLSRLKTKKEQTEIIKQLRTGQIDVIIGTHRLLSEDVEFKNLGLLVVDEEQRFGVRHKERLKQLKKDIDVLTMTATPIPRTLHMAMMSVRDMSILSSPPRNRYPVRTYVLEHNETIILDAIRRELARGGQVFYLYNRVNGIYRRAQWLSDNFPDANVDIGHGKMDENQLEDIMYDMVSGKTQILVCTTIIETGLDIPNANTMIIENADRMGLAQLYQLRGRVGRSNRSAYAYLTYQKDKILDEVSQKRLSAIREFTEFGSGFKIAMRDLEIRGAGNILGAQQHGHMDSVGYDMYCKLLKQSIDQARGITGTSEDTDVTIDISINAYIPEAYISSVSQRIDMYKKIAAIENESDQLEIRDELIDRYGEPPRSVLNIIAVAALKPTAKAVGCTEIRERMRVVTIAFDTDRLTPDIVFGLDNVYKGRVKLISGERPALTVTMRPSDGAPLEFVGDVLKNIKELQGEQ